MRECCQATPRVRLITNIMKRILWLTAGGGLTLLLGFYAGRAFQHAQTGYQFTLLEQKEYASELGPIRFSRFWESVGVALFDTEWTKISVGNRTIYQAQRDFQEGVPSARNIATSSNAITWDDGDFRYRLSVEELPPAGLGTNRTTTATGSR